MMIRAVFAIALVSILLPGCQRETDGKLVELTGRIFVFNYRVATANYLVTLRKLGPLPEGSTAVAEFENPKGGETLTTREKIFAVDEKIAIQSPHLQCVRKDHPYAVTIRILGSSGEVLQEIETSITSDVDQTVLPTKPLVIGPGYEANPEVFGTGGAADYGKAEACPT
jgi:hypothetical protein